jgi:hypothetical protein
MIRMISGWTMIELESNHSIHSIGEIKAPHVSGGVVPDDDGILAEIENPMEQK